jgi:hypothetical protein
MQELSSVRVKIARGEMHYRELSADIELFRKRKPYTVISDIDPNTGEQIWKVDGELISVPPLPMLGDALYNFRSALDHLAWQLVLKAGGTPDQRTEFPIFKNPGRWSSESPRDMAGMSQPMKDLIKAHQPCFGTNAHENRTLWALQQYGNTDKHRNLILVNTSLEGIFWHPSGGDDRVVVHYGPVEKDTILARFPSTYMKTHINIMPGIAFGEPPWLNESVQLVLYSIKTWVPRIVDEFESAFF